MPKQKTRDELVVDYQLSVSALRWAAVGAETARASLLTLISNRIGMVADMMASGDERETGELFKLAIEKFPTEHKTEERTSTQWKPQTSL